MSAAAEAGAQPKAVRSRAVELAGPAGLLEALIDEPPGPRAPAVAVICHPHPRHQGTMHNKVVHTLARTFARRGVPAIRFNYRGVGRSQGEYAGGDGETHDAESVIDWALDAHRGAALYLGGFSFGGMVAIRAAVSRTPRALVTVAPAIRFFAAAFESPKCPWLVLQGSADELVAAAEVERWAGALTPAPVMQTLPGVGHHFHGALGELGAAADAFLEGLPASHAARDGVAGC